LPPATHEPRATRRPSSPFYPELDDFLANPVVDVLPVDEDMAGIYADIIVGDETS
jgi:hypothetical protein